MHKAKKKILKNSKKTASTNLDVFYIFLRYFSLVFLSIGNLALFYWAFTPLTLFSVLGALKLFYNAQLIYPASIVIGLFQIDLIPACIAGSAYYLLVLLNLITPMKPLQRVKSLLFLLISFLALNIIRIIVFSILALNNYSYFDITHKLFWYFGSTILVVLLWFSNVKIFKIKSIPAYTDLRKLYAQAKK